MIELNVSQSNDDQWHVERHGCVTGTKLESAIGACYSNTTGLWDMGGKTWQITEGVMTLIAIDGWTKDDELKCDLDYEKHQKSLLSATDKTIEKINEREKARLIKVELSKESKKNAQLKPCIAKQQTILLELVSDLQSEVEIDDYCSADMQRGNDLEPLSVTAASDKHKVKLEVCGMLQSDTMPSFKFSPDAIYRSNGVIVGGYETKSKMGKKHIEYQLEKRVPPEHLIQCLAPMIMDDSVKWWIFGHFDDRNHVNNLFTTGIKRENYEDFIQCAREVLKEFFEKLNVTVNKMGGKYNG